MTVNLKKKMINGCSNRCWNNLLGGYVLTHKMLDNLLKANQCFVLTQMQRQSRFKGSPAVAGILPLALAAAVSELSLVVLDSTV